MAEDDELEGTPYFFAARRPFKEAELLSYIRREHRKGRHLGEIIDDPFVHSLGSRNFVWATLRDTPHAGSCPPGREGLTPEFPVRGLKPGPP